MSLFKSTNSLEFLLVNRNSSKTSDQPASTCLKETFTRNKIYELILSAIKNLHLGNITKPPTGNLFRLSFTAKTKSICFESFLKPFLGAHHPVAIEFLLKDWRDLFQRCWKGLGPNIHFLQLTPNQQPMASHKGRKTKQD